MECFICKNIFVDPRILSCRHTFCLNCIENTISRIKQVYRIKCPVCNVYEEIPNGNTISLKKNHFVQFLKRFANANVNNQLCGGCMETKLKESIKYCTDCDLYLCSNCSSCHSKIKSTSKHAIIEIKNMESVEENLKNQLMCEKHQKIEKDLFCVECKIIICCKCYALLHTKHEIKDVGQIIIEKRHEINKNLKILENNLNEINHVVSKNFKKKSEILNSKKDILQQIDRHAYKLTQEIKIKATKCKAEVHAHTNELICNVNRHTAEIHKLKDKLKVLKEDHSKTLLKSHLIKNLHLGNNDDLDVNYKRVDIKKFEYSPFIFRCSEVDFNLGGLFVKDINVKFLQWIPRIEYNKCFLVIDENINLLYLVEQCECTLSLSIYNIITLKHEKNERKVLRASYKYSSCIQIGNYLLMSSENQPFINKINLKTFESIKVYLSYFNNSMKLFNKTGNEFYFFLENTSKIGLSKLYSSPITLVTMIELNKPILSCLQYNEQLLCCYTEDNKTFQLGRINLKTSKVTSVSNLSFEYDCKNHIPLRADRQKKILFINDQKALFILNEKFEQIFKYAFKDCDDLLLNRSYMVCDEKHGKLIFSIPDSPKLAVLKYDDHNKLDEFKKGSNL